MANCYLLGGGGVIPKWQLIFLSVTICDFFYFSDFLIYIYTQGVSRLVDITAGLCDQKSSYKHVCDFGRLWSYDGLKLRIEGKDY